MFFVWWSEASIFEKSADYVASKRTLTTLCLPASERLTNSLNKMPMKD